MPKDGPGEEWKSADGFGVGWLIVTCCVFVQLTFEAIGLVNACSHSERGFNSVEWVGLNVGLASDPPAADWALSVMAIPMLWKARWGIGDYVIGPKSPCYSG